MDETRGTTGQVVNYYINNPYHDNFLTVDATMSWNAGGVLSTVQVKKDEKGIHPELFFKYAKKKLGLLEGLKLNRRIERLEKAFNNAVENGQDALGTKMMTELMRETRESVIFSKGITHFIERADLYKHKRNIRGGHISDTRFKDFTRVIPKSVLEKKKKAEAVFDDFIIFHYWNEETEKKREAKQKISEDERARMRDPILFGIIKESDRLYFIADWEDEFCDLTFDEIVDVVGETKLTKEPKLNF